MIITIGKLLCAFVLTCAHAAQASTLPISQRSADARPYISCDVIVDKHHVVVGERVEFKVRVVYDPRTYTVQTIVPPTPAAMALEFLSKSPKEQQQVNGVSCNVYELDGVLYPKKTGVLDLEPFLVKADQRTSTSRGLMGLVMNSSISLYSQKVSFQVQPLPATALKASGIVGDYMCATVELERTNFSAGEAIMMRYSVKGLGNAALCEHPELRLPQDVKWYPAESKKEVDGHCFEYALQATGDGDMLLPEQSFVYFSPLHRKYMQLKTVPIWVHVSHSKHGKIPDQPVHEQVDQRAATHVQEQEIVVEADDESHISLLRTVVIPDRLFGFLVGLGMLCLCVMRMHVWFFACITSVVRWWRYRALLSRARRSAKEMKKNRDVEPVYGAFKELQAMIDWNRMRILEKNKNVAVRSDAWHAFWQRMEYARFDTDRSGEITQDFVQEALAWVTYFEM